LLIATTIFAPSATVIIVLGLLGWLEIARLIEGKPVLKRQEFVLAAQALGGSHSHIMVCVLPNVISIALMRLQLAPGQ
jgi:ABC-type dipeptide/oligopeptide/nickel transport system permease subunit